MQVRWLRLAAVVAGALSWLVMAPALASANDTASVGGDGVTTIVGSPDADQIHIEGGAHPQEAGYPAPFGVEAWETAPGQSITAGAGCTAANDPGLGHAVVYCGTDSQNHVVVDAGAGDDTVTMEASDWAGWEVPLTSATLNGEDGNDTFHVFPDLANNGSIAVDGGNGDDTVDSLDGNSYQCPQGYTSTITGDAGNDNLAAQSGSRCATTIHGGDDNDTIDGGSGTDQLFGDAGNDIVRGGGGNDMIDGGAGQDIMSAADDPLDPGTMTFNAVDGEADTITCGYGPDTANVDQFDTVPSASSPNACAKVNRTGGPGGAPQTALDTHPKGRTHSRNAKFTFSSSEPGTFKCQLDGKAFKACASPKKYRHLKLGKHLFKVEAIDSSGEPDPTPAKFRWKILG